MDEKLVAIAQYDNSEMAHIDRIALEEAGIDAIVENENLSIAGLYYSLPTCAVKLCVRKTDEERARQILLEIQNAGPAPEETDIPAEGEKEI